MKTKKTYYLFTMLTVLIAHTVVLSIWLADNEPVQKHANFRSGSILEKSSDLSSIKVEYLNTKDSTDLLPSVLNILGNKSK